MTFPGTDCHEHVAVLSPSAHSRIQPLFGGIALSVVMSRLSQTSINALCALLVGSSIPSRWTKWSVGAAWQPLSARVASLLAARKPPARGSPRRRRVYGQPSSDDYAGFTEAAAGLRESVVTLDDAGPGAECSGVLRHPRAVAVCAHQRSSRSTDETVGRRGRDTSAVLCLHQRRLGGNSRAI
jgi:hypothetical protein